MSTVPEVTPKLINHSGLNPEKWVKAENRKGTRGNSVTPGVSARGVKCPRLPEVPPKKSSGIKPRKEVSRLGIEREHGKIV